MSTTRRTTRATSRQARSETGSVGVPESDITATPRRSARTRGGTPLPNVGLRASTAYGTNNPAANSTGQGPRGSEQIDDVLQNVLDGQRAGSASARNTPAPESLQNGTGRNRSGWRTGTLGDDRSYNHESGIFGAAGLESTIGEYNELDAISEESVSRVNSGVHQQLMNEKIERIYAREHVRRPVVAATAALEIPRVKVPRAEVPAGEVPASPVVDRIERLKTVVGGSISKVWTFLKSSDIWKYSIVLLISGAVLALLSNSPMPIDGDGSNNATPIRFYGKTNFAHNIGQFIPEVVAHPLNFFNDKEVKSLRQRMSAVEYDVQHLKQQSELGSNAISQLQDILPSHVICKRDQRGALKITPEFWRALEDKLRSETDLFKLKVSKFNSAKEVEQVVEKKAGVLWDKFLISNQAKIQTLVGKEFDRKLPSKLGNLLKDADIVTKSEFVKMVRQSWDDTQTEIKTEVKKLTTELDRTTSKIIKLQQDSANAELLKPMVTSILKTLIPAAQLEALSKANLNLNLNHGLHRVNHFSPGTGAIVNVMVTSPTYRFPALAIPLWQHAFRYLYFRGTPNSPNPPSSALTRWDEHGDCWCSPARGLHGFGASLGVLTSHDLIPDEFVLEHIPGSASLEPGSAPQHIELLTKIDDFDTYNVVRALSMDIFQDSIGEQEHPYPYVKIAEARFDASGGRPVQAFPVQLDLKAFGPRAKSDSFIVRVKDNWGMGRVEYTCLYRVRLHGEIVKDAAAAI